MPRRLRPVPPRPRTCWCSRRPCRRTGGTPRAGMGASAPLRPAPPSPAPVPPRPGPRGPRPLLTWRDARRSPRLAELLEGVHWSAERRGRAAGAALGVSGAAATAGCAARVAGHVGAAEAAAAPGFPEDPGTMISSCSRPRPAAARRTRARSPARPRSGRGSLGGGSARRPGESRSGWRLSSLEA